MNDKDNAKKEPLELPSEPIHLAPLHRDTLYVPIVGRTPLILQRFSEKARKAILDKNMGKAKTKQAPKDPIAEYNAARYITEKGRDGIPAVAFKAAIADAYIHFDGIQKKQIKLAVFVHPDDYAVTGEPVVLIDGEPAMREDYVRFGMSSTDLRFRPEYKTWRATLRVEYLPTLLTRDSLIHLVDAAGYGGVGEWRPSAPKSATGIFGQFQVEREEMNL